MLFTNQIQYFQIITMAYFGVSGAVGKNKISYNSRVGDALVSLTLCYNLKL
jgi:hypothetical protein